MKLRSKTILIHWDSESICHCAGRTGSEFYFGSILYFFFDIRSDSIHQTIGGGAVRDTNDNSPTPHFLLVYIDFYCLLGLDFASLNKKMSRDNDPDPERALYPFVVGIDIPKWIPSNAYSECHYCHVKFSRGHRHNCRLCGQVRGCVVGGSNIEVANSKGEDRA